jgi:hypothetical protein
LLAVADRPATTIREQSRRHDIFKRSAHQSGDVPVHQICIDALSRAAQNAHKLGLGSFSRDQAKNQLTAGAVFACSGFVFSFHNNFVEYL